jgi:hypothetical protein
MFDKIKIWWRWEAQYMHKDFAHGVKNLWRWFPTIWKDRDWDHDFIYNLLAKKLEFQAKYIGDRGFHTETKHDATRMRLVAKLIKLQQDDFYAMEYLNYQNTKEYWEELDWTFVEWKQDTISETYDDYFAKYPLCYKHAIKFIKANQTRFTHKQPHKEKSVIAMVMGNLRQTKCKELIFKILNQNIERWWD